MMNGFGQIVSVCQLYIDFRVLLNNLSAGIAIYKYAVQVCCNVSLVEKWFVVLFAAGPSLSPILTSYRYKVENAARFALQNWELGAAHDNAVMWTQAIHRP